MNNAGSGFSSPTSSETPHTSKYPSSPSRRITSFTALGWFAMIPTRYRPASAARHGRTSSCSASGGYAQCFDASASNAAMSASGPRNRRANSPRNEPDWAARASRYTSSNSSSVKLAPSARSAVWIARA